MNYAKRVVVVVVVGTPQKRGVCANEANVKLRKVNAPKKKKNRAPKTLAIGGISDHITHTTRCQAKAYEQEKCKIALLFRSHTHTHIFIELEPIKNVTHLAEYTPAPSL